eukprot:TRINITY_DN66901_c0_g1_i1.p2 TRINITY_DN66901_c0_g1~~TRINITY_DN66901_c0_g1_i1.p2  ORF type:complete len:1271 (-),score=141.08 TRINITY_DN66901_c0_g1_i1:6070-9858(-)
MQDMTRSLRYLFLLLFVGVSGVAMAQVGGIAGRVLDNSKEPLIGAFVEVREGGVKKITVVTDEDGNYMAKPLSPGRYEVTVQYTGFKKNVTNGVIVSPDKNTNLNITMVSATSLTDVVVTTYKVPLVDPTSEKTTITSEQIEKMPTRSTQTVVAQSAGVYKKSEGDNTLNLGGSRGDAAVYIIDGIRVYSNRGTNLSQGAVDQVEVMQSGVSAKYGDAIGGIINITTKGVSKQLAGGVLLEKSVDGYGHNLVNFNLSGPLFSKKVDSVTKKPIVGFRIDGDFYYDKDRTPWWTSHYQPNDDALQRVSDKPLTATPTSNGTKVFNYSTEFLRQSDFHTVKARPKANVTEGRLNGRLDFQLDDNLNLQVGGTFNYSSQYNYNRALSLFALDAIPQLQNYTGRAYVRLTQRFSTAPVNPGEKKPAISNAYYSIQADYQKEYQSQNNPTFGEDLFKYYYVGKFKTDYISVYTPGVDDTTGLSGIRMVLDRFPNGVTYERSELNPTLANYTTQFFNEYGSKPTSLSSIYAQNYLTNGYTPNAVYGRYNNVGNSIGGYQKFSLDQFAVGVDASFDFQPGKIRHQIEFGLYYQQQQERFFSASNFAGGTNLWQYARQLSNSHISLDYSNPIFLINGQQYTREQVIAGVVSPSPYDTIIYSRQVDTISTFGQNLRNKLGMKASDYVDVDNYDPSTFSLDMFSADELQNSGNPFVNYRGYDYTGKRLKGQVNFNDFFTKKDANGNYTREVGAYRPSYIAGYLLDKFSYKDINFNLGVRIDRFDANTKVLKDPYSLYETYNAQDVTNGAYKVDNPSRQVTNTLNNNVRPSNIGDDYVVYVNNNQSTVSNVIGYRHGDDWYDYSGKLIEDPNVLKNYSGGRDPQPFLKNATDNIKSASFDPDKSFTDYKPQVNVAPRISFSFPVAEQALFYAHYDVMVQRPTEGVFTPASAYYYLTNNTQDIINNPNLKSQKLIDYEVGFKQALTKQTAVTITAFYKERRDMIQVRPYQFAWPVTYFTYGNRDFSTAKGFTVTYDMRRIGNLRMNIAYTLQFAEGTGSNSQTTARNGNIGSGILQNFISAGLPNMRMTNVLDYDSRHNIVANLDYRYDQNQGPVVGGKHILQNAGINIIGRARSGEPYTKYRKPTLTTNEIDGGINGSRLGWHFGIDARLDKDFELNKLFTGKTASETPGKRPLMLNAYVYVTNLFNIKDIINVDGFTGRADDDGYLASPQGQLTTQTQVSSLSYIDYYNMSLWNNNNINLPRRINLGLQLNF